MQLLIPNSSYYNTANDYEKLRFIYRPPGGSDIFGQFNRVTGWVQSNNNSNSNTGWTRYHHTFTTGSAGTYRVGFSPIILEINGQEFGEHN